MIDEKLIRIEGTGRTGRNRHIQFNATFGSFIPNLWQWRRRLTALPTLHRFQRHKIALDGSLNGAHDGSGLNATGKMKIHFGTRE